MEVPEREPGLLSYMYDLRGGVRPGGYDHPADREGYGGSGAARRRGGVPCRVCAGNAARGRGT